MISHTHNDNITKIMAALYTTCTNLPPALRGGVLAIGNFDGVHRGHRALIAAATDTARAMGAPVHVMTFAPHPRRVFCPDAPPFLLTAPSQKQRHFTTLGITAHFALPFDAALACMPAAQFVEDILIKALGVRHVMVGEGFVFGHKRGGNTALLRDYAARGCFGLTCLPPVLCKDGGVFSSTRIRAHIAQGALDDAASLLGYAWEMESSVIHGDKRGRTIGYPTANQRVDDYVHLPFGIYAVRACPEEREEGNKAQWLDGVASFGIRPMFETPQPLLETYIFNFAQDIYGRNMRVQPVRLLRPEMKFDTLDALTAQIRQDCADAAAVLKQAAAL